MYEDEIMKSFVFSSNSKEIFNSDRKNFISKWSKYNDRYSSYDENISTFNKDISVEMSSEKEISPKLLKTKRLRKDNSNNENIDPSEKQILERKKNFRRKFKDYLNNGGELLSIIDRPIDENMNEPYKYTIDWIKRLTKKPGYTGLTYLINHLEKLQDTFNKNKKEIFNYIINIDRERTNILKWNGICIKCSKVHLYENCLLYK